MKRIHVNIRNVAFHLDKELTQVEIAEQAHVSRQTVNRLWRGKGIQDVHFPTLEAIAEVLECSPLDFLSVTEE